MSTHEKEKIVRLNGFLGKSKGQTVGEAQGFWLFLYEERKIRENRGFFPGKTCELLFVRGTSSFYNK